MKGTVDGSINKHLCLPLNLQMKNKGKHKCSLLELKYENGSCQRRVKTHQFHRGSRYKKEELCESFKGLMNFFFTKAEKNLKSVNVSGDILQRLQ